MTRALIDHFADPGSWTVELRSMTSAVFAVIAHDPKLIAPVGQVYEEARQSLRDDGLSEGVSEHVLFATDGLWLNWVHGLSDVNAELVTRTAQMLRSVLHWAESADPRDITH